MSYLQSIINYNKVQIFANDAGKYGVKIDGKIVIDPEYDFIDLVSTVKEIPVFLGVIDVGDTLSQYLITNIKVNNKKEEIFKTIYGPFYEIKFYKNYYFCKLYENKEEYAMYRHVGELMESFLPEHIYENIIYDEMGNACLVAKNKNKEYIYYYDEITGKFIVKQ